MDVVRAVVGAPVQQEVRAVLHDGAVLVTDRVDRDRVVVVRRVVVVVGLLVRRRRDDGDAVRVGVVDGILGEGRVVERAVRLLDHARTAVDGEDHALGEVVHVGDEAVAHLDRDEHGVRRRADTAAVRRLGARVLGLAGAVAIGDVVEGVVVVLVKVPPGDVVDIAVGVGVDPIREDLDQVLGIDDAIAVHVTHPAVLRVRAVGEVVADVENPVLVPVVAGGRTLRKRQLGSVQVHLGGEIVHRAGVLPFDPRVEDREHHVGTTGGHLPGQVHARAAHPEELLGRVRHGRVDQARETEVGRAQVRRDRRRVRGWQEEVRLVVGGVRAGRRQGTTAGRIRELGARQCGREQEQQSRETTLPHRGPPRRTERCCERCEPNA